MPRLINAFEQLFASDSLSGGPYLALNYSSLSGSFTVAETITGGTSGATAVIQNDITPQITCRTVSGEFQVGETITGGTSGATATLDNFFLYDFPNGASPLENGKIDFFESGSSTVRKTTYSDAAETAANANPLIINGDGRVPNVYGTGSYRAVLSTATGVQIAVRDPIGGDDAGGFGSDWSASTTYSETDVVRDADKYWQSLVDSNSNNKPSTDGGTNWTEVDFLDIATNSTNIATNTTNIATNTTNIATNTTNLPEYAANGDFYADSGSADAYVLSTVDSKLAPSSYTDGMQIRFETSNANTGASTVNVAGLGVKNIKLSGGADPAAGDIDGRTELVFDLANDWCELQRDNQIGVNQTWQDVRLSRAAGVTYTNTTGRPIMINISINPSTTTVTFDVDSIQVASGVNNPDTSSTRNNLSVIVPNGSDYILSSGAGIDSWTELR